MKTYSVLTALREPTENDEPPRNPVKEAWFHVPRRSCDQLMAFFMQYSPDPYALDFAEQNGFVEADSLDRKNKRRKKKRVSRDDDSRSRSSTSSSLLDQSTEEYVGTKKVEREWEVRDGAELTFHSFSRVGGCAGGRRALRQQGWIVVTPKQA